MKDSKLNFKAPLNQKSRQQNKRYLKKKMRKQLLKLT